MQEKSLLIFIPAHNEAETISDVITGARAVIRSEYHIEPDVLVIDDGSSDNTKTLAEALGATVIRNPESIRLGNVFKQAVEYTVEYKYDFLLTMDGDKQFHPEEIPLLLTPVMNGEIAFTSGNRFKSGNKIEHMSKTKKIGNKIVARMVNYILGTTYTDVSCGFRAYSREALLNLNLFGGFTYTQEVFLNLGFKGISIREIPISVTYYPTRKSRVARSILRYGTQVLKIILSSLIYYKPLKFFGTVTAILWFFSIPTFVILSYRFIETGLISPYKALGIMSVLGLTIGALLLAIGVILYSLSRQQLSLDKLLYYAKRQQ